MGRPAGRGPPVRRGGRRRPPPRAGHERPHPPPPPLGPRRRHDDPGRLDQRPSRCLGGLRGARVGHAPGRPAHRPARRPPLERAGPRRRARRLGPGLPRPPRGAVLHPPLASVVDLIGTPAAPSRATLCATAEWRTSADEARRLPTRIRRQGTIHGTDDDTTRTTVPADHPPRRGGPRSAHLLPALRARPGAHRSGRDRTGCAERLRPGRGDEGRDRRHLRHRGRPRSPRSRPPVRAGSPRHRRSTTPASWPAHRTRGPADITVPFTYDSVTGIVDDIALHRAGPATAWLRVDNDQGLVAGLAAVNGGTRQVLSGTEDPTGPRLPLDRVNWSSVHGGQRPKRVLRARGHGRRRRPGRGDDYLRPAPGWRQGAGRAFVLTRGMTASYGWIGRHVTLDGASTGYTIAEVTVRHRRSGDDWACYGDDVQHTPGTCAALSRGVRVDSTGTPRPLVRQRDWSRPAAVAIARSTPLVPRRRPVAVDALVV